MALEPAVYVAPPSTGNDNDVAVSTTSSDATATGLGDNAEGMITITCDVAFNVKFGTSAVADPSAVYPFPAGAYSFTPGKHTHFKLRATSAGNAKWWKSHRGA